jgi:hypothetical protein
MIESNHDTSYRYLELQHGSAQEGREDLSTRF